MMTAVPFRSINISHYRPSPEGSRLEGAQRPICSPHLLSWLLLCRICKWAADRARALPLESVLTVEPHCARGL